MRHQYAIDFLDGTKDAFYSQDGEIDEVIDVIMKKHEGKKVENVFLIGYQGWRKLDCDVINERKKKSESNEWKVIFHDNTTKTFKSTQKNLPSNIKKVMDEDKSICNIIME